MDKTQEHQLENTWALWYHNGKDDWTLDSYKKIYEYLRNESIYVPSWASGAFAEIEVRYPWSLQSVTLNKKITTRPHKLPTTTNGSMALVRTRLN